MIPLAALLAACPCYTASRSSNTHNCAVEAANGKGAAKSDSGG